MSENYIKKDERALRALELIARGIETISMDLERIAQAQEESNQIAREWNEANPLKESKTNGQKDSEDVLEFPVRMKRGLLAEIVNYKEESK